MPQHSNTALENSSNEPNDGGPRDWRLGFCHNSLHSKVFDEYVIFIDWRLDFNDTPAQINN
jgi:hypothetical protein